MPELYVKDDLSNKKCFEVYNDESFIAQASPGKFTIEEAMNDLWERNKDDLTSMCYTDENGKEHWMSHVFVGDGTAQNFDLKEAK